MNGPVVTGVLEAMAFVAVLLLGVLGGLNLRDALDKWRGGSAAHFEDKP